MRFNRSPNFGAIEMLKPDTTDVIVGIVPHDVPERFVRLNVVAELTGTGKSTLYRLVAKGRFPRPISPFGGHKKVWRLSDVNHWIAERAAGRPA